MRLRRIVCGNSSCRHIARTNSSSRTLLRREAGTNCDGGCNGSYSRTAPCCGRSGQKRASLRARPGRPAPEADSSGRVLGLRGNTGCRRRTGIRLQCLFEPMAKSMDPVSMVGALRHAASPQTVLLAVLSRRAGIARCRTDWPDAAQCSVRHLVEEGRSVDRVNRNHSQESSVWAFKYKAMRRT
jgi:hypothetical protein